MLKNDYLENLDILIILSPLCDIVESFLSKEILSRIFNGVHRAQVESRSSVKRADRRCELRSPLSVKRERESTRGKMSNISLLLIDDLRAGETTR